jgi:SAM-dependent methyltransferase
MAEPAAANTAQAEYWNLQAGPVWAENQGRLDRQLDPLGRAAQRALDPRPGERLLDVGCGCGHTTLQLADAVAPEGVVTGIDISRPMLEVARSRAGNAPVRFVEADAQTGDLAPGVAEGAYDAVYSRFGVMFFEDPPRAFANIARAVRPGGRLAFVCWRAVTENAWMRGPFEAAAALLPPPKPGDPLAPGPFAFADPARIRAVLEGGGWTDVEIAPHDQAIGAGGVEESLALALRVGPLGAALREWPDLTGKVIDAVRAFFARHDGPGGVRLPSATWIVTARRPQAGTGV